MFEDALLESSPRRVSVLCRIHYLLSTLVGTIFFALGWCLLPWVLAFGGERALFVAAATVGLAAEAYALMLCYVWGDTRQQHLHAWPWLGFTLLLNLPGFLIYLVYSAHKSGDWKRASLPLAYIAESMLVGVLILVPLIHTQALPKQLLIGEIHISPPPGPPPMRTAGPRTRPAPRATVDLTLAPAFIPTGVTRVVDTPQPPREVAGDGPTVIGGIPGGSAGGPADWVIDGMPSGGQLPPPPPTHVAPGQKMIRVGGNVIAAQGLYQPSPVYPPLATMARVQGTVVLQAIIGTDGTIKDLKVLSGHPLLVRAALEAVKTWRYQPTLLNTEPVEVLTEINVTFKLGE
jgi:periplasmic protein TonB